MYNFNIFKCLALKYIKASRINKTGGLQIE